MQGKGQRTSAKQLTICEDDPVTPKDGNAELECLPPLVGYLSVLCVLRNENHMNGGARKAGVEYLRNSPGAKSKQIRTI